MDMSNRKHEEILRDMTQRPGSYPFTLAFTHIVLISHAVNMVIHCLRGITPRREQIKKRHYSKPL